MLGFSFLLQSIMATITLYGLDIGKHTFHLAGQDVHGAPVFKRQFTRSSLTPS